MAYSSHPGTETPETKRLIRFLRARLKAHYIAEASGKLERGDGSSPGI